MRPVTCILGIGLVTSVTGNKSLEMDAKLHGTNWKNIYKYNSHMYVYIYI